MSGDRWRYDPEKCDGDVCPCDCDNCDRGEWEGDEWEGMTEDITYCIANCKSKSHCERDPKRIRRHNIPHSYSDFSNVCERYVRDAEGDEWEELRKEQNRE